MNKQVFTGLVLLLVAVLFFSGCLGPSEPSETVKIGQSSEVVSSHSSTTPVSSPPSSKEEVVAEVESSDTIAGNLTAIAETAKRLNDFNIGYMDDYRRIVKDLSKYGVTVDPELLTPYGEFEYSTGLVFVATVQNEETKPVPDSQDYTITFTTRTGVSENDKGYGARQKVANDLRRFVRSKRYTGKDRHVVYRLKVSEDGKSAMLTLESGKWW